MALHTLDAEESTSQKNPRLVTTQATPRATPRINKHLKDIITFNRKYLLAMKRPTTGTKTARALKPEVAEKVVLFYERDDNVTRLPLTRCVPKKSKKPICYLKYTTKQLFKKFTNIYGPILKLTKFRKLRPSHIKLRQKTPLLQCLCVKCENASLKLESLMGRLKDSRFSDLYVWNKVSLCAQSNLCCCMRKCKTCGLKDIKTDLKQKYSHFLGQTIEWKEWVNMVKEESKVKKLTPVTQQGNVEDLIDTLIDVSQELSLHLFVAQWQHRQYVSAKEYLKVGWVLMTSDFAENIRSDSQRQPSSVHWHYQQITLHPVVCDYVCPVEGCSKVATTSMIILSDDLKHDGFSVHEFENAALQELCHSLDVEKVIKFSDNCACQYKSKLPFYLLTMGSPNIPVVQERNYFGSNHGKSRCDGETGVVKTLILQGVKSLELQIKCAKDIADYLTKINDEKEQEEEEDHVHFKRKILLNNNVRREAPPQLKAVTGTRTIHSIRPTGEGKVEARFLSCFCAGCRGGSDNCENKDIVGNWKFHSLTSLDNDVAPIVSKNEEEILVETIQSDVAPIVSNNGEEILVETIPSATNVPQERKLFFEGILDDLNKAKTFRQFIKAVKRYNIPVSEAYPLPLRLADQPEKKIDISAAAMYPIDVVQRIPTEIVGDGNCLPRCGSMGLFGDEQYHTEIRVRMIIEMSLHMDKYVDHDFLAGGSCIDNCESLPSVYCQFVDHVDKFEDKDISSPDLIEQLYR